jgi:hypothetical protein
MTTPDLKALEALTRNYATFQSRKSGLATALGGLLAVVLVIAALSPNFMGAQVTDHLLVEYLVWVPFLWLVLKGLSSRVFYRGLGTVKAEADGAYERRRWFWILGLALFLLLVLTAALYAFASGFLQANHTRAAAHPLPLWILLMPLLYLLPMPWAIRGIEEARVYAVLVGQCILWLVPFFLFNFGPSTPPMASGWGLFGNVTGIGLVVLFELVQIWGALALVRGWKEHREYLAFMKGLPEVEA